MDIKGASSAVNVNVGDGAITNTSFCCHRFFCCFKVHENSSSSNQLVYQIVEDRSDKVSMLQRSISVNTEQPEDNDDEKNNTLGRRIQAFQDQQRKLEQEHALKNLAFAEETYVATANANIRYTNLSNAPSSGYYSGTSEELNKGNEPEKHDSNRFTQVFSPLLETEVYPQKNEAKEELLDFRVLKAQ